MPGEHAILSPSSAERWISCPASVQLSEKYRREETDSIFAREGTAAHALAELHGRLAFGYISEDEFEAGAVRWEEEFGDVFGPPTNSDREEMFEHARDYVRVVQNLASRYRHSSVHFEERLATGVPQSWGTSDAVIVSPLAVHIVDFKYGKGVRVEAAGNPQLRLYAAGALDTYGDLLGDTEIVALTVHQPRLDHTDTEELSPDELRAWREEVVIPAAKLALGPIEKAPFGPSETACRWCPLAGACRARAEYIAETDFGVEADVLDDAEIAEILPRLTDIQRWVEDVKKEALQRAYTEGRTIPGHKVILRGGKRIIKDQAFAIQRLIDAGWEAEQVSDIRVKGITALEKLLGRTAFAETLGDLISRTEGKPAVVPETDSGVAVTAESRAAEDFADSDPS